MTMSHTITEVSVVEKHSIRSGFRFARRQKAYSKHLKLLNRYKLSCFSFTQAALMKKAERSGRAMRSSAEQGRSINPRHTGPALRVRR